LAIASGIDGPRIVDGAAQPSLQDAESVRDAL